MHANPSYLPGSQRGQGRAQSVAQVRQTQRAGLEVLWAEGRGTPAGRSAPAHRTELPPRTVCSSTLRPCQVSLTPGRVCSGVPFLTGKGLSPTVVTRLSWSRGAVQDKLSPLGAWWGWRVTLRKLLVRMKPVR